MTCEDVNRDEIVEKYLLGQLEDGPRDAFEQHYFECARCFGLLQTYGGLRAELARTRVAIVATPTRSWIRQWAWLPAAAVVILAVSVAIWQRPGTGMAGLPSVGSPPPAVPVPAPSSGSIPSPPVKPSLEELARVEAPRYVQDRLRGAADAATARFLEGMKRYQQGDYAAARTLLQEASALDPEAPHIAFFLGISSLLVGKPDEAANGLRATVALGDSAYLEEAHFYLAKAYVSLGRIDDAIAELERTIRLRGQLAAEARLFLDQLIEVRGQGRRNAAPLTPGRTR